MSICSSNITKDSTPLKNKKTKNLTEIEDIDLIGAISSLIEDTIKRNRDKKNIRKKPFFSAKLRKSQLFLYIIIYFLFILILI